MPEGAGGKPGGMRTPGGGGGKGFPPGGTMPTGGGGNPGANGNPGGGGLTQAELLSEKYA